MAKKVYAKIEVGFSSKKRERCCKFDLHAPEANFWEDLESRISDSIRNTLDRRIQFYEDEIRKLSEQRWSQLGTSESLAFMFEMAHLHEDALHEYDELELLFKLNHPFEVASRGYSFIISFSKALALHERKLPFCMREVWVITACLALVNATKSQYNDGNVAPEIEKEFYRLQGDLYSLCRIKFLRLAYLIGYGTEIERSPVNSASLSMFPWPKPAVWPLVPNDASSEMILQETPRVKHFGIQRKPLPLEPTVLIREANRRRASLSAGNTSEMFDGRPGPADG
ncbi:hypothetical protein DITRI_Ditri01bG0156500 [Diplodiscus trichospermus]